MFDYLRNRRMQSIEEVSQLEPVLLHRLLMTAFDYRKACARQNAWLLTVKGLVHGSKLSEVGDLGGPSNVSRSRQRVILNHRSEGHIRAEAIRTASRELNQLFFAERVARALHHEAPVLAGNCGASTVVHYEQWNHVIGHMNLCVVAGFFELAAPLDQSTRDLARFLDRRCVKRCCYLLQFLVERIQQHDAVLAKEPRHQTRERIREPDAFGVTLAKVSFERGHELGGSNL